MAAVFPVRRKSETAGVGEKTDQAVATVLALQQQAHQRVPRPVHALTVLRGAESVTEGSPYHSVAKTNTCTSLLIHLMEMILSMHRTFCA